jgi:hypothetical protein
MVQAEVIAESEWNLGSLSIGRDGGRARLPLDAVRKMVAHLRSLRRAQGDGSGYRLRRAVRDADLGGDGSAQPDVRTEEPDLAVGVDFDPAAEGELVGDLAGALDLRADRLRASAVVLLHDLLVDLRLFVRQLAQIDDRRGCAGRGDAGGQEPDQQRYGSERKSTGWHCGSSYGSYLWTWQRVLNAE